MDLFQLETFLAVASEGSFSRAARKLYRTQPAISQSIRKLEQEVGEPLVDRSSHEGKLTDAGKVLEDYAQRLLNMRGEALSALEELRQLNKGKLGIGANELTCMYLLPVLNRFRHVSPMIKITVLRSLASRIPDQLLNHDAELGVLTFRPDESLFKSVVVYRDELCFVVHPAHPLAKNREVHIRQLGAECFVAHHVPSPYRARVLDMFQKKKVPLHMDVEMPTLEGIKKFVAMGNGVALLPSICVESEVARGELIRIAVPELAFARKFRLVWRKGAALSHAARAFLKVAEIYAREKKGPYLYSVER